MLLDTRGRLVGAPFKFHTAILACLAALCLTKLRKTTCKAFRVGQAVVADRKLPHLEVFC